MTDDDAGAVNRFLSAAVNVLGSGAGAIYGLATGDQITSAVGGAVLAGAAGELAHRMLSNREQARIGGVLASASAALVLREVEGHPLRTDGFFDGEPSSWDEFAEGALLAAKNQYEEKKLRHLGNMLAVIATEPKIDGATANFVVGAAERISWLEMCLLAIVSEPEEYPRPERDIDHRGERSWFVWTVQQATEVMRTDNPGYFGYGTRKTPPDALELDLPDLRLSALRLSSGGQLLSAALGVHEIAPSDLRPVYQALVRDSGLPQEAD